MANQPAPDDYTLTAFPEGLAAFAGVDVGLITRPGVASEALRVAESAILDVEKCAAARAVLATGPLDPAVGTEDWRPRLAQLYHGEELRQLATEAGFETGEYGAELAGLAQS